MQIQLFSIYINKTENFGTPVYCLKYSGLCQNHSKHDKNAQIKGWLKYEKKDHHTAMMFIEDFKMLIRVFQIFN